MKTTILALAVLALVAGCNSSSPVAPVPEGIHVGLDTSPHELEASEFWHRDGSGFHAAGNWHGEPVTVTVTLNQRGTIASIRSTSPVGCDLVYVEGIAIGSTAPSPGCEVTTGGGIVWRVW